MAGPYSHVALELPLVPLGYFVPPEHVNVVIVDNHVALQSHHHSLGHLLIFVEQDLLVVVEIV